MHFLQMDDELSQRRQSKERDIDDAEHEWKGDDDRHCKYLNQSIAQAVTVPLLLVAIRIDEQVFCSLFLRSVAGAVCKQSSEVYARILLLTSPYIEISVPIL